VPEPLRVLAPEFLLVLATVCLRLKFSLKIKKNFSGVPGTWSEKSNNLLLLKAVSCSLGVIIYYSAD